VFLLVGGGAVFGVFFLGETSVTEIARGVGHEGFVVLGAIAGAVLALGIAFPLAVIVVAASESGPPDRAVRLFTGIGAVLGAVAEVVLLFAFDVWTGGPEPFVSRHRTSMPVLNAFAALAVCTAIGAWCGRALIIGQLRRSGRVPSAAIWTVLPRPAWCLRRAAGT
jgi:hypothetical protein